MPGMPRAVRLAVARSLTLRRAARSLPISHACIRQEPPSTYATRTLLAHSATTIARPHVAVADYGSYADHVVIAHHIDALPAMSVGHF